MNSSTLKKLVQKYYNDKASAAERYVIDRWYESFDLDKNDFSWLEEKKRLSEIENRIMEEVIRPPKTIPWYNAPFLKIAAIFVVILSVGIAVYFNPLPRQPTLPVIAAKTFHTTAGEIKRIVLTDRSEVTLNANSSLTVLADYGQKERVLKLVGEAYFNVQKDSIHPFTVHTSAVAVKVLGTSFNVQAYESLKNITVKVSTGKVQVADRTQAIAVLLPGEQLVYDKETQVIEKSTIAVETNKEWIAGKIVLKDASFDELAQNVLNVYGKKIKSDHPAVLKNAYTLTLRSGSNYEDLLEQLCIMVNKKYRKEGKDEIVIY